MIAFGSRLAELYNRCPLSTCLNSPEYVQHTWRFRKEEYRTNHPKLNHIIDNTLLWYGIWTQGLMLRNPYVYVYMSILAYRGGSKQKKGKLALCGGGNPCDDQLLKQFIIPFCGTHSHLQRTILLDIPKCHWWPLMAHGVHGADGCVQKTWCGPPRETSHFLSRENCDETMDTVSCFETNHCQSNARLGIISFGIGYLMVLDLAWMGPRLAPLSGET